MEYFIDIADQTEIQNWKDFVVGATSNPLLLNKAGIDSLKFYRNNESLFKNIFVQIASLKEVENLIQSGVSPKQLIFKVPLLKTTGYDGFKLLKQLISSNLRTCSTIVYDVSQFDYACEAGSEFSIVLYAKNDNPMIMYECSELKQRRGYKTKIVSASFRSADHVKDCLLAGADYATVPPKIMKEVFENQNAIKDFDIFYGE